MIWLTCAPESEKVITVRGWRMISRTASRSKLTFGWRKNWSRSRRDLDQFFLQPNVNFDLDAVLEIMRHPRTVMTFSDSGAHVSQIMDASIQTVLLGYWVRERQAFTLEEAI